MSFIDSNWWWVFAACASVFFMAVLAILLTCTGISYHRRSKLHHAILEAQKRYTQLSEEEEAISRNMEAARSSRSSNSGGGSVTRAAPPTGAYLSMYSVYSGVDEQPRRDSAPTTEEKREEKRRRQLPTVLSMRDLSQPRASISANGADRRRSSQVAHDPPTQRHLDGVSAVPSAAANLVPDDDKCAAVEKPAPPAPVREASTVGRGFTHVPSEKKSRRSRTQSFVMEDVEMMDSPTASRDQSPPPARTAVPPPVRGGSLLINRGGVSSGQARALAAAAPASSNPFAMANHHIYPGEAASSPYTYKPRR